MSYDDEEERMAGKKFRQASNLLNDADLERKNIRTAVAIFLGIVFLVVCGLLAMYSLGVIQWTRIW